MKKYEYITRTYSYCEINETSVEGYLNEMGQNGWELVQISEVFVEGILGVAKRTFYFKREVRKK